MHQPPRLPHSAILRRLLAALAFCLLAWAPAGAGAREAAGAEPLETVTLQLKWRHQFQFAGYYAALAKGFYADEGLDLRIVEGGVGIDVYDEVESGRAQYGVCGSEILLEYAAGRPFAALAVIFQHSPSTLLVLQGSGVHSPHDLAGKRVMLSRDGEPDIRAMFLQEGLSLDQMTLAEPTWDVEELIDGRVDAMAAYVTNTPFLLMRRAAPFEEIKPRSYGVDFYGDGLFTTRAEIETRPDRAARFLTASLKGWDYAMAHPQEIVNLILERYPADKNRYHLFYEARAMDELVMPELVQMGHMNPGRWERMAETYAELGMMAPGVSLEGFLYDPAANPDASRLRLIVRASLGVILASCLLIAFLWGFIRRLRTEVARRSLAEAALRRSELRLRSVFLGLPLPAFTWQAQAGDFRLLDYNAAADQLTRGEVAQWLGKTAGELAEEMPALLSDLHRARDEKRVIHHKIAHRPTGEARDLILDITAAPIGPDLVLAHVEDVTERERTQETLRAAKESAEAADRMKSQFLANTGHELSTPLHAVLGMADLLDNTALSREQRDYLASIQEAARNLMNLLNDILDYSTLEAGPKELRPDLFALQGLVESVLAPLAQAAMEKGLTLSSRVSRDAPGLLVGDGPLLRQALANLADNAVKFTNEGRVELGVDLLDSTPLPDGGREATLGFAVRDTGIGIAAKDQERIFDSFTQADGELSRRYPGTGLGLAIARSIVNLLGGTLTVRSEPGKGSEFSFSLRFPVPGDLG